MQACSQICNTTFRSESTISNEGIAFVKLQSIDSGYVGITTNNSLYYYRSSDGNLLLISNSIVDFYAEEDSIFYIKLELGQKTVCLETLDMNSCFDSMNFSNPSSLYYSLSQNMLYVYSNTSLDLYVYNLADENPIATPILNLSTQNTIKDYNNQSIGIKSLEYDEIHSDLYIVINNYVYVMDCIDNIIWFIFEEIPSNIDKLFIMSDNFSSLEKFTVVCFVFKLGSFYVWHPFSQISSNISSSSLTNSTFSNSQILDATPIFNNEYFVVLYQSTINNTPNFSLIVFSYDSKPYKTFKLSNNISPNMGFLNYLNYSDNFFLYNLEQDSLDFNLTGMSLFASFPKCMNCSYENLFFSNETSYSCSKSNTCDQNDLDSYCLRNCDSDCLTCDSLSYNCTSCNNGWFLSNNSCVLECPANMSPDINYTANLLTGFCYCSSDLTWQNTCVTNCPVGTIRNNSVCQLNCPQNFFFQPTNSCLDNCFDYSDSNISNGVSLCLRKCPNNLYIPLLNNSTNNFYSCVNVCNVSYFSNDNFSCEKCSENCNFCTSNTNCSVCISNFVNFNGTCLSSCPSNTFQEPDSTICSLCNGNCSRCVGSKNTCTSCNTPFLIFNGSCLLTCPSNSFQEPDSTICSLCNGNCSRCVGSQNTCTSCNTPFLLFNDTCLSICPSNTFQDPDSNYTNCSLCNGNCSRCVGSQNTCTSCNTPFLLFNDTCLSICPSNTFQDPDSNYTNCSLCISSCLGCFGSPNNCTSCISPFVLLNNSCLDTCPSNTFQNPDSQCQLCNDPNCITCSDEYTCKTCNLGYLLNYTSCVNSCFFNEYYDLNITGCLSCSSNCSGCFGPSPSNCLTCSNPFYLKGTECKDPCNFQDPCPVINSTLSVTLGKSLTAKNSFYLIFSQDLEIPSYVVLNNLLNLTVENVDPSFYDYDVETVDGYNDRLVVSLNFNVSMQDPTISLEFTNYSQTYIHGQYNTTFELNNLTGLNITLNTILKPSEDQATFAIKQQLTSTTYQSLLGSIVSLSVVTYLINSKRMSLFWFLTDAMQMISTLMFLNLNYSFRLMDCFKKMLFFYGNFLFSVGKEFDENSQTLLYFGHQIYQNYQNDNFYNFLMTENFILNGGPPILFISLIYVLILFFKLVLIMNRKFLEYDDTQGVWRFVNYFYNFHLFSMLIRVHFVLMYIILISAFLQMSNISSNDSLNKAGLGLAILSLIYYVCFFMFVSWKVCNNKEVYENDERISCYNCLFYDLEVLSLVKRNHFIMVQIKKFFICVILVLTVQKKADQVFIYLLIFIQILSILRYVKWRPFQDYKISLINIITEFLVLIVLITVVKIQKTQIGGNTTGAISNDSIEQVENNGDATSTLIILLLGGYFILFCLIFMYYFCKNIECICYVCFNITGENYEKYEEETDALKNKSGEHSKSSVDNKCEKKAEKDLEYSPVTIEIAEKKVIKDEKQQEK